MARYAEVAAETQPSTAESTEMAHMCNLRYRKSEALILPASAPATCLHGRDAWEGRGRGATT